MSDITVRILLFIFLFCLGAAVRRIKHISQDVPEMLLRFIFYFGLPLAVFWAITSTPFNFDSVFLPISAILVVSITGLFSFIVGKLLKLKPKQLGVLLVSTMILNTSFSLPFFGAFYGTKGLAAFSLFDLGNLFLLFTLVYYIALYLGHVKGGTQLIIKKLLTSPPLWVIMISIALSFNNFVLPTEISNFLAYINYFVFMIVMFTLGMLFKPQLDHFKLIAVGLIMRIVLGLVLGYAVSGFFGLQDLDRLAVIIGSASPNGYTTLVYASIAKLDKHYAASLVSVSLLVGIILTPLLLFFIK